LENFYRKLILVPLIFLLFSSTVSAYPQYDRDIILDTTCAPGSTSYVLGLQAGSDNGFYPKVNFVRIYFEWYRNGVFIGSKQNEDSTAPINVANYTASCSHDSSQSYKMVWSERWETEDYNVWTPGSTIYW
jgi:hypothetical protein